MLQGRLSGEGNFPSLGPDIFVSCCRITLSLYSDPIISVNRWAHGYTTGGPGDSTRIGRQPFGRITIANADSAPDADAKTAIMMAHRAVGELQQ